MKLLLLIHAVLSAINSLPRIEDDSSGPYWSQNGFEGVLQEPSNSSDLFQPRFSRPNADNIKAPLERLQMIARITNGIYLYQGLSAGSIPADALISELLFFGSVKPSDIAQMDYQKIQTTIELLWESAGEFGCYNAGSQQILKEVDGIGSIKEWTKGKEHFKTEIEKLANSGTNTTILNTLSFIAPWKGLVDRINNNQADQDTFPDIKKVLNSLKKAITDINKTDLEWTFTGFAKAIDGIAPITKAAKGVETFQGKYNDVEITDDMVNAYPTFLEAKAKKFISLTSVTPQLAAIKSLIYTRQRRNRQRHLQHTHGLPSGTSDVTMMVHNAGYPWIRRIVTTDALKTAFKKFETIESLLSGLESSLTFNDDGVTKMNRLVMHALAAMDIFNNTDAVKTGLTEGQKCKHPPHNVIDPGKFTDFRTSLETIDTKLTDLKKQKNHLSDALKTQGLIEMCDDVIAMCENAQKASDVQGSVAQFKKYGKLEQLNGIFTTITSIVSQINIIVPDSVKTDAQAAKGNFSGLDTYHTGLNNYADYFKCLQDKKELKSVFEMVAHINKIRGYNTDESYSTSLQDGLDVVKKVAEARGDLDKLKAAITKWNGTDTNGLEEFKEIDEHSKVIGESVRESVKKEKDNKSLLTYVYGGLGFLVILVCSTIYLYAFDYEMKHNEKAEASTPANTEPLVKDYDERSSIPPIDDKTIRTLILYDVISGKSIDESFKNICEMAGDNSITFYEFQFFYYRFVNGHRDLDDKSSASKSPKLLDLPSDVWKLIVDELDIIDRVILRNVCKKIQKFSENLKVECQEIQIRNSGDHVSCNYTPWRSTSIIYATPEFSAKGHHEDTLLICGKDPQRMVFEDVSWIVKNPKHKLDSLMIDCEKSDRFVPNLTKMKNRISVALLEIHPSNSSELLAVLQQLTPGELAEIHVHGDKWMKGTSVNNFPKAIKTIIDSEQWRKTSEVVLHGMLFFFPEESLVNFQCITIYDAALENIDIFVRVIEVFLRSEHFVEAYLYPNELDKVEQTLKSIARAAPDVGIPHVTHYWISSFDNFLDILCIKNREKKIYIKKAFTSYHFDI